MATVCSHCDYAFNADQTSRCAVCGGALSSTFSGDLGETEHLLDSGGPSSPPTAPPQPEAPRRDFREGRATRREDTIAEQDGEVLQGRLSHLERYDERPPRNVYRLIAHILIWVLVGIPYAALFLASGVLSLAFAITGFAALSHIFNPFNWTATVLELMEVLVLRRLRGSDNIPVYRGMVEDALGRESPFIFLGPLLLGNLVVGHHLRLQGTRRNGTFLVRGGTDLTTSSAISSSYRDPWRVICLILLTIYMGLALLPLFYRPDSAAIFRNLF